MMLIVDLGVKYRRTSAMVAKRESMVTAPSPRRQRQPDLRILDALGRVRAQIARCGRGKERTGAKSTAERPIAL